MKRIVFAAPGWNLAEVTRMLEIAKACGPELEPLFLSYGGRFEPLISDAGFEIRGLEPRWTDTTIERFSQVDTGQDRGSYFDPDTLRDRVRAEIELFEEVSPAAVVTGFCLSVPLSTRAAEIPLVWVIGSPWLRDYFDENLGTWPDQLDNGLTRLLPSAALNWLGNRLTPVFFGLQFREFNAAAKSLGLAPFKGMDLFAGDHALVAEPPRFSGIGALPEHCRFIGPLIAKLDGEIPAELQDLPGGERVVWFSMGSSGRPEFVREIVEGFARRDYTVIAPILGLTEKIDIHVPDNVIATGFVPAHAINPMADVSVIHGGIGTVMTACLSATPIVGVGMQPEQEANLECVARLGFGIRIPRRRLTAEDVLEAIDSQLDDADAKSKATGFAEHCAAWDGPGNAAAFLRDTFAADPATTQ